MQSKRVRCCNSSVLAAINQSNQQSTAVAVDRSPEVLCGCV